MLKYVTIPDIRRYSSYRSINARILYMHLAMSMDIGTRTYAHSWRQLSADLDMPLQQLRTALKQLEKDGLVTTQQVTQTVTYGVTQRVTHKVTQIYIMSVSDLDEATNEATNSSTNSSTNSPTNSPTNSDKNNINTLNSSSPTHTTARVDWAKKAEELGSVLKIDAVQASELVADFRTRQELKGKTWEGDGDLLAHLISWSEKRLPLPPMGKKAARKSDAQIRKEKYQEVVDEQKAKTQRDKDYESLLRTWRWYNEYKKKEDDEMTKKMKDYYDQQAADFKKKYGELKAS